MRLIMEPTTEDSTEYRIVIQTRYDGLNIAELKEIIRSLLLAAGYQLDCVEKMFGESEDEDECW